MRIIIGLGNPGKKYLTTRHNAGFLFVDALAIKYGATWQLEKKFQATLAEASTPEGKILFVKPSTFMNCSGEAVAAILRYYKSGPENIIVAHDDLDISAATYKITESSRAAGHNGVQSIIDTLDTQDFTRVRLGIGRSLETLGVCIASHDYVLSPFQSEEQEKLTDLFPEIFTKLSL